VRHGKSAALLSLARTLAGSAEGMTLDEMAAEVGADRRTAERMRDAIRTVFPQMEELQDGPRKRFRITGGLDGFMQAPTADELAELHGAIGALRSAEGEARAALLESLASKVQGALRAQARRRVAPDLEALMGAETHAMRAGPRPQADPEVLSAIRAALKSLSALSFTYGAGPEDARLRTVSPCMGGRITWSAPRRGKPSRCYGASIVLANRVSAALRIWHRRAGLLPTLRRSRSVFSKKSRYMWCCAFQQRWRWMRASFCFTRRSCWSRSRMEVCWFGSRRVGCWRWRTMYLGGVLM
jgi:hypothetical protein